MDIEGATASSSTKDRFDDNAHIVDGEVELHNLTIQRLTQHVITSSSASVSVDSGTDPVAGLMLYQFSAMVTMFRLGINDWTTDTKIRHLNGLTVLFDLLNYDIAFITVGNHLPVIYIALSQCIIHVSHIPYLSIV